MNNPGLEDSVFKYIELVAENGMVYTHVRRCRLRIKGYIVGVRIFW